MKILTSKYSVVRKAAIDAVQLLLLGLLAIGNSSLYADESKKSLKERLVGDYRLEGVSEMGSGVRLNADGTYNFFLLVGSVDEVDSGKWEVDDAIAVLHSTVKGTNPEIKLLRSSKEEISSVRISFDSEGSFVASYIINTSLHSNGRLYSANRKYEKYQQSNEAELPIQKIEMRFSGVMRDYGRFEFKDLDSNHNSFLFRVDIGNYGNVRFNGLQARLVGDELYLKMPNSSREGKYVRVKSKQ